MLNFVFTAAAKLNDCFVFMGTGILVYFGSKHLVIIFTNASFIYRALILVKYFRLYAIRDKLYEC